jgi:hypothetical protein
MPLPFQTLIRRTSWLTAAPCSFWFIWAMSPALRPPETCCEFSSGWMPTWAMIVALLRAAARERCWTSMFSS